MPRPPIDLNQMIREVPRHSALLHPEADRPIRHFEESANAASSLLKYLQDHIDPSDVYRAVYDRHFGHLRRMALAEMLESFERFLKELASVCIDYLALLVNHKRPSRDLVNLLSRQASELRSATARTWTSFEPR